MNRPDQDDRPATVVPRYALEVVAVVLLVLWVVGWLVVRVASGLIHLALLLALVAIVARFLRPRRS